MKSENLINQIDERKVNFNRKRRHGNKKVGMKEKETSRGANNRQRKYYAIFCFTNVLWLNRERKDDRNANRA